MTISLTSRQADCLRFIAGFTEAKGYGPSRQEIADGLGLLRKNSAHELVVLLEQRGAIRRLKGRARSIEVLTAVPLPRDPQGVPLQFIPMGGPQ